MHKLFKLLICLLFVVELNAVNFKIALAQLTKKTYVDFDLGLSVHEKKLLEKIKVKPIENTYDNYGKSNALGVDLTLFFQSMGNDYKISSKAARLVAKLVCTIVKDLACESYWLTIRPQTYVNRYDIPRWHQDGYYYNPHKPTPKVFLTLKGSATLFCNLSTNEAKDFKKIYYKSQGEYSYYGELPEGRQELAKLIDSSKIHQAEPYMGTVLIAGGADATIHSEPPIHEEKIFISIVPGTKEQIKELQTAHASTS